MIFTVLGLYITIVCFLNYMSFHFMKSLNKKPEFKDSFSPKLMSYSKIPPIALVITLFLVTFGTLLIIIESIQLSRKK